MTISMRPSKKRRLINTPAAKLKRKAYALEHKNPAVRKKETKANKVYYKRNKAKLLKKAAITRRARHGR